MSRKIYNIPARSVDVHEFDLLPGYIQRSNKPEAIDLSAPLRKYRKDDGVDPNYIIRISLMPAAMQCISGTPDNTASNLAMYHFTDVAGVANSTQPLERQVGVTRKIKEAGARIIPTAINTHDYEERVPALVDAGANLFIVDTSQGWSDYQKETIAFVKQEYRDIPIWGGNIVSPDGFCFLVEECGADAVKVGMGVGAGCITQDVLGLARRQGTAIMEVAKARDEYYESNGVYVPIIADGGIKTFSDIPKAYALGADVVMVGRLLAGSDETPNPLYIVKFLKNGNVAYEGKGKEFWYEASDRARMLAEGQIRDYSYRYEEGKEGWIKSTGPMLEFLNRGFIKIRDGIRKAGCNRINRLHEESSDIHSLHKDSELEFAERTVDPNDPDIAIWDPKHVEVFIDKEWVPSTQLQEHLAKRRV